MFDEITDTPLLLKFGLILLLGFLVGIERGWRFKKKRGLAYGRYTNLYPDCPLRRFMGIAE